MLYPTYRLATEGDGSLRVQRLARRSLRPTVIVPRAACVFESMPSAGVRLFERADFARMQAARLAPFESTGSNAVVRGNRLMLWFWDEHEVEQALRAAGVTTAHRRTVVETLLQGAPEGEGSVRVACIGGIDVQTRRGGAIETSEWLADPAVQAAPSRRVPWSHELLAGGTRWRLRGDPTQALIVGAVAALAFGAGHAAYWWGSLQGAQQRLDTLSTQAEERTASLGSAAEARRRSGEDRAWVDAYRGAAASVRLEELLAALTPVLEHHGVAIREIEMRQDEVRLVLASAGVEIDVPNLLRALSRVPGLADVQLRQAADTALATFSLRAPGYVRSPEPGQEAAR